MPELTRRIHRLVEAGDHEGAICWQYQLVPLFDAMISLGEFPEGFRAGTRARGWDLGRGRVPITSAQQQQVDAMQPKINGLVEDVLKHLKGRTDLKLRPRFSLQKVLFIQ